MISLKKYLDGDETCVNPGASLAREDDSDLLTGSLAAYGAAMLAMGNCSLVACPGLGEELKKKLDGLRLGLAITMSREALEETDCAIQGHLQEWGREAVGYNHDKAREVKDLLLVIARSAEAASTRDQRCATQMSNVTARLRQIATLDDVTQIRASVEKGAAELKSSIERMTAGNKAAVEELRQEVRVYQAKLEDAEELASRDSLTCIRNRMCLESMIESRIAADSVFCVAMLDIDGFKKVNDTHGHAVGDELLKLFASELRSAVRVGDVVGRWGGDEFVMLFDCDLSEAMARVSRLNQWLRGDYTVHRKEKALVLHIEVSVGLADHRKGEGVKTLMGRADAAMYERKAAARSAKQIAVSRIS